MPRRPSVLFLVEGDATNPIAYYRGHLPNRALRLRRWQTFVSHKGVVYGNDMFGSESLDGATDIVVFRRPVNDEGHTVNFADQIRAARAAGQRIYSDLDDDYWNLPPTNPASNLIGPEDTQTWQDNIDASDGLICSTTGLAESMRSHTSVPIHVCPNGIDPALYTPRLAEHDGPLRVGWLGPWEWRKDDLAFVAEWLVPMLNDRADRVTFTHLGATLLDKGGVEDLLWGLKCPIVKVAWVPFVCLEQSLQQVDVLIIPQRLGGAHEAFANSRSPTSAMAAVASGICVWATPILSYREFFGDALPMGSDGLAELLDSKAARSHYRRAQKRLLQKVNLEATAKAYEKVLSDAR